MKMSLKRTFYKCITRGGSPQGVSPNAKYVAFWGYYLCSPISYTSMPFPFPPHSLPLPLPSSISPCLPFPTEVNKKLSYRAQNALSIIKTHERKRTRANISTYTVSICTSV